MVLKHANMADRSSLMQWIVDVLVLILRPQKLNYIVEAPSRRGEACNVLRNFFMYAVYRLKPSLQCRNMPLASR